MFSSSWVWHSGNRPARASSGSVTRMPATTSSPWALVRYSPVTTFSPVRGLRVKQTPVALSSPRLPKTIETTLTAETAVSGILLTRRKKTARSE